MTAASGSDENRKRRFFYGWPLAGVAFLLYGLQVAGFYSWGFYLPEMAKDLSLTRAQGGLVLGVATLCGGLASPLVGVAIGRFGLRWVMTAGFGASALGYLATAAAQSFWQLLLVYGVATAGTHAFATVIPTQTLAATWFIKYRARVLAVLLAAGGLMSGFIYSFNAWLLGVSTWRTGWVVIAALNVTLALIAAALVRDSPEKVGQLPDGASSLAEVKANLPASDAAAEKFTTAQAIRTPQFLLMVVCGLGYALPWGVLGSHSRLHLQDLGFDLEAAAWILALMATVSTFGRLSGALGDFISPPRLLALALLLEGSGIALLLVATTTLRATVAVTLVGLGFGMAYISQAATFARFFGRVAFATTTGIRFSIGAAFGFVAPWLAGLAYDTRSSYAIPFLTLAAISIAGAAVAAVIRAPELPASGS